MKLLKLNNREKEYKKLKDVTPDDERWEDCK